MNALQYHQTDKKLHVVWIALCHVIIYKYFMG